jgi:hypothetical protein
MTKHVARTGEIRRACIFLVAKLKRRNHLEESDVDGRAILKQILKK